MENFIWSLQEGEKELKPLIFSNGKSQEDIVKEVGRAVKEGFRIIFIKGVCGTGKSAIALNLAKHFGRASIVVPIKTLQEQYSKDYTDKKYVLSKTKDKLKICTIVGRKNFKCKFIQESGKEKFGSKEKDLKLFDIFDKVSTGEKFTEDSCDNSQIPCKIEIKEKNMVKLKQYLRQNPQVNFRDFTSLKDIKRMSIAPVCPYWTPILNDSFETKKFSDHKKIKYVGLDNNSFVIYKKGSMCPYYEQYLAYADADVIIFNSQKYKIETLMNRKPATEIEIIDECDEFLDSFSEEQQLSINRLAYALSFAFPKNDAEKRALDELTDLVNSIRISKDYKNQPADKIFDLKSTKIHQLFELLLDNNEIIDYSDNEDSNYLFRAYEIAKTFEDFFDETFFSIEARDNDLLIHLVATNLSKRFNEMVDKNKIFVMMSGTVHSESVLKNIFGLEKFKIIEAETENPGELVSNKKGYEINCKYSNFQSQKISRSHYLKALSQSILLAKKPILVHVNSFSDLPTEREKEDFNLENLPSQQQLIQEQREDPLGNRIKDFKNKKMDVLFTTKCNRGIDFPGEICNSIIVTRFPYPNVSSIFWRILKKTKPAHFMSFYMDKANRELLQKVYRGLRSKNDKVELLSPDIRVLEYFEGKN